MSTPAGRLRPSILGITGWALIATGAAIGTTGLALSGITLLGGLLVVAGGHLVASAVTRTRTRARRTLAS